MEKMKWSAIISLALGMFLCVCPIPFHISRVYECVRYEEGEQKDEKVQVSIEGWYYRTLLPGRMNHFKGEIVLSCFPSAEEDDLWVVGLNKKPMEWGQLQYQSGNCCNLYLEKGFQQFVISLSGEDYLLYPADDAADRIEQIRETF